MDEEKQTELLAARGWRIADSRLNGDGRLVILLEHEQHPSVAMFKPDVTELATGRATIEQIMERNKGADLADPWPVPAE